MSRRSPPPTRRRVLAASAAAGVASLFSKHLAIAGVTGSIEASQQGELQRGYQTKLFVDEMRASFKSLR